MLELVLPELDAGKIRIHSDDQICHANAEARALPEEDWRLLEAPLLAGVGTLLTCTPSWTSTAPALCICLFQAAFSTDPASFMIYLSGTCS